MSKYADKWKKITRTQYNKLFKRYDGNNKKLHVYATFTNTEPSRLSYEPQILTTWGNHKKELIKCHTRNYKKDNEYTERFKAIHWEKE